MSQTVRVHFEPSFIALASQRATEASVIPNLDKSELSM